jgi:hypothetical protein
MDIGFRCRLAAMTCTNRPVAVFITTMTLAACGGTPPAPAATPESAASAPAPQNDTVPPSSAAAGAAAAPAASSSTPESAPPAEAAPAKRPVSVDIVVAGKHAGEESVERVVGGVKPGLESCYRTGLEGTPSAGGTVEFKIHVTDSGAIKKVESNNPNTMPGSVTNCMVGRFGALSFEPHPKTTIEVKVTCRPGS